MSDHIEIVKRICQNPKCGHDRASHFLDTVSVRGNQTYHEEKRPLTCLCRGCDCCAYEQEARTTKSTALSLWNKR